MLTFKYCRSCWVDNGENLNRRDYIPNEQVESFINELRLFHLIGTKEVNVWTLSLQAASCLCF